MSAPLDECLAALTGRRRIALLDQAVHEVAQRTPKPCGSGRCGPTCRPCTVAIAERLRELLALEEGRPADAVLAGEPVPGVPVAVADPVPPTGVVERLRHRRGGGL